ncbi:hypothetical protein B0T25DRAFT_1966 [Lasiosphaeria hispida]|uniref:Uncharacterized protein n=1 Tax=Lasiosphaeria hispida TaxID=260671 RepID=A0AAJ0HTG0_9PEZI|nr:hypothetical protein B0T25DRAFT_1966 [Lasiosphaeria hispida]
MYPILTALPSRQRQQTRVEGWDYSQRDNRIVCHPFSYYPRCLTDHTTAFSANLCLSALLRYSSYLCLNAVLLGNLKHSYPLSLLAGAPYTLPPPLNKMRVGIWDGSDTSALPELPTQTPDLCTMILEQVTSHHSLELVASAAGWSTLAAYAGKEREGRPTGVFLSPPASQVASNLKIMTKAAANLVQAELDQAKSGLVRLGKVEPGRCFWTGDLCV